MKTITEKEIMNLYKKCGLSSFENYSIRTTLNTGTLNNQLNTNYSFLSQNSLQNNAVSIFNKKNANY